MKHFKFEGYKKLARGAYIKWLQFIKWVVISGIIGVVVGLTGTAFSYGMNWATQQRNAHPRIILGLPLAGLVIVFLYHLAKRDNDKGTNSVLLAIRSKEQLAITVAPLIFISTILTHLFGGSAGREGAALQMGGSIGNWFGKVFRLKSAEVRVVIMCGMSACFAALFGTPLAAAVFSMEVVNVGIMYYSALVPCVLASLIAVGIAGVCGVPKEVMTILEIPEFTFETGAKTLLLSILCAVVSISFCMVLHFVAKQAQKWFPNAAVRIVVAGIVIIGLTALIQSTDYLGTGMHVIEHCIMSGEAKPFAFLLKMLFTAITLGAGYKGGEIVPTFFVGATFGCVMGSVLCLPASLCAAVGMIAVFCGVTNSPITSLLIALELFGMDAAWFFLLAVGISYMLSGYHSLYHTQKIVYSKYDAGEADMM